jgi:hypothetical protein
MKDIGRDKEILPPHRRVKEYLKGAIFTLENEIIFVKVMNGMQS